MKKLLLILLCVPLIGLGQTGVKSVNEGAAQEYFDLAYNKDMGLVGNQIYNYTNCIELVEADLKSKIKISYSRKILLAKAYLNRGGNISRISKPQ